MIVPIDDPGDPRIAGFREVRERDLVGRQGRFVAEGEVVLRHLVGGRHRPLALLLAEKRAAALQPLLDRLEPQTPVYVAAQPVMDQVVGFHIHRGILALGERAAEPSPDDLLAGLPTRALVVVAVGIGNHDNIGGVFRNAAAFGADAVLLDPGCCDPLYRKALRVSVGAALVTPFARIGPEEDLVGLLERNAFEPVALSPAGDTPLTEFGRSERTAVLLGAEGPGLPDAILARARAVRIPMAAGFDSLNVATTSGIVLHHLQVFPFMDKGFA